MGSFARATHNVPDVQRQRHVALQRKMPDARLMRCWLSVCIVQCHPSPRCSASPLKSSATDVLLQRLLQQHRSHDTESYAHLFHIFCVSCQLFKILTHFRVLDDLASNTTCAGLESLKTVMSIAGARVKTAGAFDGNAWCHVQDSEHFLLEDFDACPIICACSQSSSGCPACGVLGGIIRRAVPEMVCRMHLGGGTSILVQVPLGMS